MTIKEAIDDLLLACLVDNKSPNTIADYRQNLADLPEFCQQHGIQKVHEIEPQLIRKWLGAKKQNIRYNSIAGGDYAVKAKWKAARRLFNFCVSNRYMLSNPIYDGEITEPKTTDKMPSIFTQGEIRIMMQACGKDRKFLPLRNKAIISTFLSTAARLDELVSMELGHLNIDNGHVKIPRGKGNKERVARLGEKSRKLLVAYLYVRRDSLEERLWLTEEKTPLKNSAVQSMLRELAKRAGISRRVHPHMFRHTFAVEFLRRGGNLRDLQIYGGWSTLDSVKPYLRALTSDDALNAHKKYNPADWMI